MKIGIIAAEYKEMLAIKEMMTKIKEKKIFNLVFFSGKINDKNCVLVECKVGKINATRVTEILIDKFNIDALKKSLDEKDQNIIIGNIGSADKFVVNMCDAIDIGKNFNVDELDMEAGAIAQVCYLDNIPYLIIREISDIANGNNKYDFHKYLEKASKDVAFILGKMLSTDFFMEE